MLLNLHTNCDKEYIGPESIPDCSKDQQNGSEHLLVLTKLLDNNQRMVEGIEAALYLGHQ